MEFFATGGLTLHERTYASLESEGIVFGYSREAFY
jgi:hypothetical protein